MIPEWAKDVGLLVVIVGLVGRLIWGYIQEARKRRSAGDQVPIWKELKPWCNENMNKLQEKLETEIAHAKKEWETEMGHVAELIEGHLERGRERFVKVEATQEKLVEALNAQTLAFGLLKQTIEKSNGSEKSSGS